ncbi:lipid-A-disaccharide synthase [Neisseria sp. ZJ106]|uniref:Lipid-A-disaccharide synthase n=1 Tax=Neisseria lisongii TaxID=2912188 RepID=A0ABY7RI98_9NEIS|nr:lipid-A-disaccharide synthase [Neisseria lisongii]MCF7521026.1 lipid-A-disaccharide synthase [Neisseria lisongii]WCL71173.1 lipid-A-disaccharide synthase [Neisseria lisongii]
MNQTTNLLTVAICVGEASGDLLGAHLMRALRQQRPDIRFVGIGGERMKAEGFESLYDQEKLAVRGFVEVIKRLPAILSIRKGIVNDLIRIRPDVFVGIDAPDFNLGVAQKLKAAGIPTLHYVSPSVWAWRRERVNTIVHQVNKVLCLFPMEPQLYLDAGGRAEFVGHPMAQTMPLENDRAAARQTLGLAEHIPVFALLPGSRTSEIDYMAPVFFQTALLLLKKYPNARFLLPAATAATRRRLTALLAQPEFAALPLLMTDKQSDLVCTAADVVLVTSGTATLEVALCKRPMVISYKISPLTYAYVKRKIKVPHVGLPNILLGREAVPELLQHDATPEKLAAAVSDWYDQPQKTAALQEDFRQLHLLLKQDTAALAAAAVLAEIPAKQNEQRPSEK